METPENPTDLDLNELPAEGEEPPPQDAVPAVVDDGGILDPEQSQDGPRSGADLEAVYDVPVQVSAVLGKATLQVSQLLKLGRGAVVELDRKVGEAIDIYINDRLVARGEVVVVEDRLGVTMTEIIKSEYR